MSKYGTEQGSEGGIADTPVPEVPKRREEAGLQLSRVIAAETKEKIAFQDGSGYIPHHKYTENDKSIPAGTFDAGEEVPVAVVGQNGIAPEEEANGANAAASPEELQQAWVLFNQLGYLDQNDSLANLIRHFNDAKSKGNGAQMNLIEGAYKDLMKSMRLEDSSKLSDEQQDQLWLVLNNGARFGLPNGDPYMPSVEPADAISPPVAVTPPAEQGTMPTPAVAFPSAPAAPTVIEELPIASQANLELEQHRTLLLDARSKFAELSAKLQRNLIPIRFRKNDRAKLAAAEQAYREAVQGYYSHVIDPNENFETRTIHFAGAMINEQHELWNAKKEKLIGDGKLRHFVEWWGKASRGKKVAAGILIGAGVGIPASFLGFGLPAAAALAGILGGGKSFLNEAGKSLVAPPQPNAEISWQDLTNMLANSRNAEVTHDKKLIQQMVWEAKVANAQRAIQGRDVDAWTKMIQSMTGDFDSGISQDRRRTARNVAVMTGVAVGSSVLSHIGTDVVREGVTTGHWPWSGNTAQATLPTSGGGQTLPSDGGKVSPNNLPGPSATPPPVNVPPVTPSFNVPADALNVTRGEGWLQTFHELGLNNTQAWAAVNDPNTMQQFYDSGWAYLRPQDGLAGISHTGELPAQLLQNVWDKWH